MVEDVLVLSPLEIHERLRDAVAAAFGMDEVRLGSAAAWLEAASARDLLRIDGFARRYRYEGPTLGKSQQWSRRVLEQSVAAAALASMHRDGFVRERAVRQLAASQTQLSDRLLAVRSGDYVGEVRDAARRALMMRTDLVHAGRIMPVLQRFESRERGGEFGVAYLDALVSLYGERETWEVLREAGDRDLRRAAFRYSIDHRLLDTTQAVTQLPGERDQVVRRLLAHVVADNADPRTIRAVLLRARAAESRALGLVKLQASQLEPGEVGPLLVDSSVLVRYWARQRWQEMGHDVLAAYREATHAATKPTTRSHAYMGLTEAGGVVDRAEVLDLVHSPESALQKAGLRLLDGNAQPEDVPALFAFVRGDHSRVARLAGDVLAGNSGLWSISQLAESKSDPSPVVRRRAWWLHRGRRGWESVIADLEVLKDSDPGLAILGRQPTAPMYFSPSDAQRDLIADMLPTSPLSREQKLGIALAAGLRELMPELRSSPRRPPLQDTPVPELNPRKPWWQRLLSHARDR